MNAPYQARPLHIHVPRVAQQVLENLARNISSKHVHGIDVRRA